MASGKGKMMLQQTLTELIDYTKHHFATEEGPDAEELLPGISSAQGGTLDALTHKVVKFRDEAAADRVVVTIDVLQFLREWLVHHIGQMNKKVGEYLRQAHSSQKIPT